MRFLVLIPLVAATAAAQQVPRKTLDKPELEYGEPFSSLTGVRELRDGRVIAADSRDKTLQAIDFSAKRGTPIGREGAGPNEWSLPMRVLPLPGDSTLVFDIGNTRYLVVGPDAKPVRTFSPLADGALDAARSGGRGDAARGDAGGAGRGSAGDAGGAGRGGAGAGGGGRVVLGGAGGPIRLGANFSVPRAVDARGRIYSQGSAIVLSESGQITSADSAPVLRYDVATRRTDTVAYVNLAKNSASGNVSRGGGGENVQIRIGGSTPFAPADDWTVLPDGRVVVVRVADYHVEVVQPGGRRVAGQPVRYTPVRVTDAEKQEWRDAQRTGQRIAVSIGGDRGGAGRSVNTVPPPGAQQEPAEWPATKPPFLGNNATWVAPSGDIWVIRTRAARDKVPTADVFDTQGKHIGVVAFPESSRLVGFSAKGVYLVRVDEDDLQYLQRHALDWGTTCPVGLRENCAPTR